MAGAFSGIGTPTYVVGGVPRQGDEKFYDVWSEPELESALMRSRRLVICPVAAELLVKHP